eukprot:GHVU01055665.1.p1 GENE.GHVU01055665.1~~GHVU01055665.1.p1  ORF type:complete len:119 (-),score=6.46 GHVU01055665.1:356-712(-)
MFFVSSSMASIRPSGFQSLQEHEAANGIRFRHPSAALPVKVSALKTAAVRVDHDGVITMEGPVPQLSQAFRSVCYLPLSTLEFVAPPSSIEGGAVEHDQPPSSLAQPAFEAPFVVSVG